MLQLYAPLSTGYARIYQHILGGREHHPCSISTGFVLPISTCILQREGADKITPPKSWLKNGRTDKTITEAEKRPCRCDYRKDAGFVNGNIMKATKNPVNIFRICWPCTKGIDRIIVTREHAVFPCRRHAGVRGVRREYVRPSRRPSYRGLAANSFTNEEDIAWFLNAVDNPHNGLTFCAGSLSAGEHNDTANSPESLHHAPTLYICAAPQPCRAETS